MATPGRPNGPSNYLLAALPPEDYERLSQSLEPVSLVIKDIVFDYDKPIDYVYFPETFVASVLGVMADGTAVETATVGREGMTGLPLYLGVDRMPAQALCQIPGDAVRMSAADFRDALAYSAALRDVLGRYTQALFALIAQAAACNRLHTMRERCARWILLCHDRVGVDEFPLTQQFLSQMLGVRRATVSEAAAELQQAGAIEYEYGRIFVRDRDALEGVSCECYGIIANEFARLLGGPERINPMRGVVTSVDGKSTVSDGTPRGKPDEV